MAPHKLRPGQKAPDSGQYGIVNRQGTKTGEERTVTKGKSLPPTPHKGQSYVIVDRTKHRKP